MLTLTQLVTLQQREWLVWKECFPSDQGPKNENSTCREFNRNLGNR
jgi:hypothetical protein